MGMWVGMNVSIPVCMLVGMRMRPGLGRKIMRMIVRVIMVMSRFPRMLVKITVGMPMRSVMGMRVRHGVLLAEIINFNYHFLKMIGKTG